MRSAAASFDDDLGFDPPARRKAARPSRSSKKRKKQKWFATTRIARYAAIGMSIAISAGIMANALLMQKGHHPAPLFAAADASRKEASAPPRPVERSAADVAAPANPAPAMIAPPIVGAAPATPKAKAPSPQPPAAAGGDAIARLLAGGPAPTGASNEKNDAKTVLAVQKALSKLGFAVKATGTMGPATKKAIEAFERNRHLPVDGEVTRRLEKVLAAESGTKID